MSSKLNITIVGGGSSAHTIIPLLSSAGHRLSVLTSQPDNWHDNIVLQYQTENGEVQKELKGNIEKVTSNPVDVIPNADIVLLCMPVSKYRVALSNIAGCISNDRKVYVGTVYGQAGFNWMVDEIKESYSLTNITTFAFGLIPWICRIVEYGKVGVTYGCKEVNVAAVYPKEDFDFLNENVFNAMCFDWFGTGKVLQSDNFLSLTLSVDNQIIHTTRCYGLYLKNNNGWKNEASVPFFYKDYDDLSAEILMKLDCDYSKVRNRIIELNPMGDYKYMLDYLALERFSYNSENTDIKTSFIESKTLGAIKTPVLKNEDGQFVLNKYHRFFSDDIHYGLCIVKSIAAMLKVEVPMVDEILDWAQTVLDEKLIENKQLIVSVDNEFDNLKFGIPECYGMQTIEDVID